MSTAKIKAPLNPFPMDPPSSDLTLPSSIFIGASSWTHEFWKGQIYHKQYKSEKEFNLHSLHEYSSCGLFNIVEIDSSFYTPPKQETLAKYAELVPDNFVFTAKVWERISIPVFPSMKRYGKFAGLENPSFLDPKVFNEQFLPPFLEESFAKKFKSFLIQFPRMETSLATSKFFLQKLETFLEAFPASFHLAIEIRNKEILTHQYIALLNRYKVAHCFTQWYPMISIKDQMKAIAVGGGLEAEFFMMRLLTPADVSYDAAGTLLEPFHQIKTRDDKARQDVVRLIRRALQKQIPAYVIVNNRFEGNTPMTISELRTLLQNELTFK